MGALSWSVDKVQPVPASVSIPLSCHLPRPVSRSVDSEDSWTKVTFWFDLSPGSPKWDTGHVLWEICEGSRGSGLMGSDGLLFPSRLWGVGAGITLAYLVSVGQQAFVQGILGHVFSALWHLCL